MGLGCAHRYAKLLRNVAVAFPLSHKRDDLMLPFCKCRPDKCHRPAYHLKQPQRICRWVTPIQRSSMYTAPEFLTVRLDHDALVDMREVFLKIFFPASPLIYIFFFIRIYNTEALAHKLGFLISEKITERLITFPHHPERSNDGRDWNVFNAEGFNPTKCGHVVFLLLGGLKVHR